MINAKAKPNMKSKGKHKKLRLKSFIAFDHPVPRPTNTNPTDVIASIALAALPGLELLSLAREVF